jgi:hypothetical protein
VRLLSIVERREPRSNLLLPESLCDMAMGLAHHPDVGVTELACDDHQRHALPHKIARVWHKPGNRQSLRGSRSFTARRNRFAF